MWPGSRDGWGREGSEGAGEVRKHSKEAGLYPKGLEKNHRGIVDRGMSRPYLHSRKTTKENVRRGLVWNKKSHLGTQKSTFQTIGKDHFPSNPLQTSALGKHDKNSLGCQIAIKV